MNTKTRLANKICAIMVIVAMMVSNFWLVGEVAVSYAIDMVKTSSNNVELSSYFIDENGIEVDYKDKCITEDEILYVKVRVKNEGYFSGVLKLENSNFEIDRDFLDEGVQEITESGEVILKQINAGTDEVIELKVKPIKRNELKLTELQGTTTVKLEGEYTNSKNVEKDKTAKVEGETEVTLNWNLPEESTLELSGEVFTNKKYEIDEDDKKVVQFLVESKITENNYPIKKSEIVLSKLDGVEKVFIEGRNLEERNKKLNFEENNDNITINIENINDEKIVWDDQKGEQVVVTYILNKDANTTDKNIKIDEKAEAYYGKELEAQLQISTEDEKEGIITYEIESADELYKGKIQTGEGKEYTTELKINVNYEKLAEEISLVEEESKYKVNEDEKQANIVYKEIKVNKDDFITIFGDEGYLTLSDENNNIIANINKETEADENGNIVIKFVNDTKKVQIKGSKPVKNGTLAIENTKEIKREEYSREEINELTSMEEVVNIKNQEVRQEIKLKNTETEAKLEANIDTLTTLEKNENVKIAVTLLNDNETKDLYQNPKIRVILPKQVRDVSAKCKLFYGNDLILGKTALLQEDGKYVIEINLDGIQSKYNAEEIRGTTIMIYAELSLDKLAVNSDENIILNYTNDIATSYKDGGKQELPIKIQSKEGIITTNNIEQYGISTIGDEGTKQINIDENTVKDASVKISAINNKETRISDVKILGHFPTKENDNLGVELKSGIKVLNQENIKIYYSEKENPTDDIGNENNGWKESGNTALTKSYLIVAESIAKGDKLEAEYDVSIPEKIPANTKAEEDYSISYLNVQSGETEAEEATTIELLSTIEENAEDKLDVKIKEFVGNDTIEEGETDKSVTRGEIIRYQLELTNKTNETINNVKVIENASSGTRGLDYVKPDQENIEDEDGVNGYSIHDFKYLPTEVTIDEYYRKDDDGAEREENETFDASKLPLRITRMISSIGPNETEKINFYVRPDKVEETLDTEFNVSFEDKEITKNMINTVNSSDINVMLLPGHPEADGSYLVGGNQYMYELTIGNYVKNNTKNVKVQIITNNMFDINCIAYDKGEEAVVANNTREIIIDDLGEATNQESNSTRIRVYAIPKEDIKDGNIAQIYAKVSYGDTTLRSNKLANKIKVLDVSLTGETDNQGGEVSVDDEIEYRFTFKNNENGISLSNIILEETFSAYIDITEVLVDGSVLSEDDYTITPKFSLTSDNILKSSDTEKILELKKQPLKTNETKEIIVRAKVNALAGRRLKQGDKISTKIVASRYEEVIAESNEVSHIFKSKETDQPDNPTEPDDPTKPDQPEVPDNPDDENKTDDQNITGDENTVGDENKTDDQNITGNNPADDKDKEDQSKEDTFNISGTAWFDENGNGAREDKEQKLSGINVRLINLVNNDSKNTQTSGDGTYTISDVKKGKYVLIFEYDKEKYMLTTYQADGVRENRNSDVENVTMKLDGIEKIVSSTDTLEITNNNITNIDIGLKLAEVFDLELDKTISKVTVINNEGTKTQTYNNEAFAKTEINAKYLEGSTVVIEYKIKVKNTGEIAGYAKSIIDYKPTDLQFDSKLNTGWYQSNNNLYSNSLSNIKIEPGETKELTLILTKTMTENNIGLVNNLAEIAESYNSAGIEDKDSKAGNKQKGEDDLGSCNLSIGVKTGSAISFIAFTTSIFTMLIIGAYLINRVIMKKNNL